MKEGFRQSMAWLHTWTGLLVGWVLFFVFVTGTFGYVNSEVSRWMRPELPLQGAPPAARSLLPAGETWLRAHGQDAERWYIFFPGRRGETQFKAGWQAWPKPGEDYGAFTLAAVDPATGAEQKGRIRETGGGEELYAMHYALRYMPYDWAIRIVGVCTMFMLVAILSGIVTHKKIFKDFFTFRPAKGQRSWLDAHNLLSVTALPFHLMITWSGLIFFLFTYMPVPIDTLYPEGPSRDRFYEQVYGEEESGKVKEAPAGNAPLAPMLGQAERKWGAGSIARLTVEHPGRADAKVVIAAHTLTTLSRNGPAMRFDGVTGARLPDDGDRGTASARFSLALLAAHEGHFAGPVLRALYVLSGLGGAAMIATGLLLWSAKRKAKLAKAGRLPFGIVLVDILNLGTIMGLPIGVAAYFWANRLIPAAMEGRAAWEMHTLFLTWGACFLYAIWRPTARAWGELTAIAIAAFGLVPVINLLTTNRHLGVSLPAGDWTLASIDLGAIGLALLFAHIRRILIRKQRAGTAAPARARQRAAEAVAA
ncbi:PepSY-associated TM helix domain-containing protein [Sphingobium cloacae]|uniref:Peptidase n=1 Tax=Sphingobium cloacae TaxID=120107 RepID=A0A1E1F564_9SPHN|nr:PepSY-associated TM helix domain-containing protein [Sphingobium cloacae]BAV65654.1 peptidase [Sphingobium cloacae]